MKKKLVLAVLSALLIFSLAACSAPAAPAPAEQPAGEEAAPAEGEQVSLRLWAHQNTTFEAGYQKLIDDYTALHPNVSITIETFEYDTYLQTLQTALPAGEEADIMSLFGTWICSYADRLASVPDDVMTVAEAEKIWYEAPLGGFVCDGKMYGMPQEFNIEYGGVLVNKAKYEEAGLTYPPQWETFDDLVEDAKALTVVGDDGMMQVAGFEFTTGDPLAFIFMSGIMQRGGSYWNADQTGFTFNTPEAKETLEWMKSIVDAGVVDPVLFNDASNWVGDAFFGNLVGIGYIGPWAVSLGQSDFPDFGEFGYFVVPHFGEEPVFAADSGWGLSVSPNSPNQKVAWDFVKFATSQEENALNWNIASSTIPGLISAAESPKLLEAMPWLEQELTLLPYGVYLGGMPDRDLVVYDILYTHILNVLQGMETVDDALQMIDEEANATFQ